MEVSFSVVIPVFREQEYINATIDHLKGLKGACNAEIIVVDGDPCAGTLRYIIEKSVLKSVSPKGRGRQMNAGACVARGDILLFLHADTRLPPAAFRRIADLMTDQNCVGGFFDLKIDSPRLPYRFIERAASVRTRLTRIPYGDQAVFLRRRYFSRIGMYKDIPIMEDVELMRRIKREGGILKAVGESVSTSPRRWEQEGILFCTMRNWWLIAAYMLGASSRKLAARYRDRKG